MNFKSLYRIRYFGIIISHHQNQTYLSSHYNSPKPMTFSLDFSKIDLTFGSNEMTHYFLFIRDLPAKVFNIRVFFIGETFTSIPGIVAFECSSIFDTSNSLFCAIFADLHVFIMHVQLHITSPYNHIFMQSRSQACPTMIIIL